MFRTMKHQHWMSAVAFVGILTMVTACGGGGGGNSGNSSAPVTLKLADMLPKTHYITQNLTQPFIDKAEQEAKSSGHKLTIQLFPDEQLGKAADQINGLKSGIFDIGNVAPPYNSEMPLGNVFDLPQMADSATALSVAYYNVSTDTNSQVYKTDFKRNGMRTLANYALPLYQFVTVNKPIDSVHALSGLKIRSGGGAQDLIIKDLGGSPVHLTTPEQYQGLQRHIIDGGIFNLPSLISNKTYEVTKYFTTNANVSSFVGSLAISDKAWQALPDWAQKTLVKAGHEATVAFAKKLPSIERQTITQLTQKGLQKTTFSDAEKKKLVDLLKPVTQTWVNDMKSKGFDGAAALQEAQAAIKKTSASGD